MSAMPIEHPVHPAPEKPIREAEERTPFFEEATRACPAAQLIEGILEAADYAYLRLQEERAGCEVSSYFDPSKACICGRAEVCDCEEEGEELFFDGGDAILAMLADPIMGFGCIWVDPARRPGRDDDNRDASIPAAVWQTEEEMGIRTALRRPKGRCASTPAPVWGLNALLAQREEAAREAALKARQRATA